MVRFVVAPTVGSGRLRACREQRLALIAFVFTAGLLPWTRLLAPGPIDWPEAGAPLQWLALATAGFALAVGYSGGVDAPWLEGTAFLLGGVVGRIFGPLPRLLPSLPLGDLGKPIVALLGVTAQRIQHSLTDPNAIARRVGLSSTGVL